MVFTDRVPTTADRPYPGPPDASPRATGRRRLLAAGAAAGALALAGCRFGGAKPAAKPDPLVPVLAGVQDLVARYDAALAAVPDLTTRLRPLRGEHAVHASLLARAIGGPSASPSRAGSPAASAAGTPSDGTSPDDGTGTGDGTDPAAVLAALRAAEQGGYAAAVAACLAAPAGSAALLASIAACRATHVEVLA